MNCYVHPQTVAIGVCSSCGQGVCDACAVKLDGKIFCKRDVQTYGTKLSKGNEEQEGESSPTFMAAGIFFALFGLLTLGTGIVLIFVGAAIGTHETNAAGIPLLQQIEGEASVTSILVGVLLIFIGALDFLAVFWLSNGDSHGGALGMGLCACWATAYAGVSVIPGAGAFGIAGFLLNLFVLFLLITGWKESE